MLAEIKLRWKVAKFTRILNAAELNDVGYLKRAFRSAGEDLSNDTTATAAMLTAARAMNHAVVEFFFQRGVLTGATSPMFRQGYTAAHFANENTDSDLQTLVNKYRCVQTAAMYDRRDAALRKRMEAAEMFNRKVEKRKLSDIFAPVFSPMQPLHTPVLT